MRLSLHVRKALLSEPKLAPTSCHDGTQACSKPGVTGRPSTRLVTVFRDEPSCCNLPRLAPEVRHLNDSVMQTFDCPKCGAPISYEPNAFGSGNIKCAYCQSQLSLPHHGQPARIISQIDINVGPQVTATAKKAVWVMVLIPLLIVVLIVGGVLAGIFGALAPLIENDQAFHKRSPRWAGQRARRFEEPPIRQTHLRARF